LQSVMLCPNPAVVCGIWVSRLICRFHQIENRISSIGNNLDGATCKRSVYLLIGVRSADEDAVAVEDFPVRLLNPALAVTSTALTICVESHGSSYVNTHQRFPADGYGSLYLILLRLIVGMHR
jgi:hypothetical protein